MTSGKVRQRHDYLVTAIVEHVEHRVVNATSAKMAAALARARIATSGASSTKVKKTLVRRIQVETVEIFPRSCHS